MTNYKKFYQSVNRANYLDPEIKFLNHGYLPLVPGTPAQLFFTSFNLYNYMLSKIDRFNSVLEIGCGRGGGYYVLQEKNIRCEYLGIDITPENINYCKHFYPEMQIIQADAQSFRDQVSKSFDVILNVESSHCYADLAKFFDQVVASMSAESSFLYCDLYDVDSYTRCEYTLPHFFEVKERTDITDNVLHSCIVTYHMLYNYVETKKLKNDVFYNFLLDLYKMKIAEYQSRDSIYVSYVLQRK